MKMQKSLLMLVVVGLLVGAVGMLTVQKVSAGLGWTTAYDVKYAFWDAGPHYGAFFPGASGGNQYFTGASGQPAGYSSWDWWGSAYDVLLLQKRWLFSHLGGDPWVGANHHAYMYGW